MWNEEGGKKSGGGGVVGGGSTRKLGTIHTPHTRHGVDRQPASEVKGDPVVINTAWLQSRKQ